MKLSYLLIRAVHGKISLVKAKLENYEEITEIYEVFGRYDIIAKVETFSGKEFRKFIQNKMRIIEGIKSIEPIFVAEGLED